MDAHEGWRVDKFYNTGEYIHIEIDKGVIMFMEGAIDEIMAKVSPKIYPKSIIMRSKAKPLLYVQVHNSLYVLMHIVLLLYRNLVNDIEAYGLHINPYNIYVSNKMINNKHMMVVWYIKNM